MTLYVDNQRIPFGRMQVCHMLTDTSDELLQAADFLGLKREWLQKAGTEYEHFDVSLNMRDRAVKQLTAREVSGQDLIRLVVRAKIA